MLYCLLGRKFSAVCRLRLYYIIWLYLNIKTKICFRCALFGSAVGSLCHISVSPGVSYRCKLLDIFWMCCNGPDFPLISHVCRFFILFSYYLIYADCCTSYIQSMAFASDYISSWVLPLTFCLCLNKKTLYIIVL